MEGYIIEKSHSEKVLCTVNALGRYESCFYSFLLKNQTLETAQTPGPGVMVPQVVVHPSRGIVRSDKKGTADAHESQQEASENYDHG